MNRFIPSRIAAPFLAVQVATGLVSVSSSAVAQETRCDVLAAHPFDPQSIATGVNFADLNAARAIAACTAALKTDEKNPRLRFELGRALERSGNYAEAAKVYRLAADDNYVAAQTALGALYQDGLGVQQDASEAVAWYRKAADLGYAVAEDNLGSAYREGRGIAKDEAQAQAWFKKAAAQFYQPAAAHLAEGTTPAKTPAPAAAAPPSPQPPPPAASPPAPTQATPQPPSPPPAAAAPTKPQPPQPSPSAPSAPAQAVPPQSPPPPAPIVPAQARPAPPKPPPAPPTQQAEAALADDPQFKSTVGVALTKCLLPEARQGNHSALDEEQAANLLIAKCQRPWVAWISECIGNGDTKESCIKKSTLFAKNAIQQSTQ